MADPVSPTDPANHDAPDGDSGEDSSSRDATGRRRKERKKSSFWRELPILIVTALVLTFLIQTFLARVYVIPSASMEPTLHGCTGCSNDRVLVDKVVYRFGEPGPGDVVVFRGPESWAGSAEFSNPEPSNVILRGLQEAASVIGLAPPDERDFVKRVIAVGGQTVEGNDRGEVFVDGRRLTEPYAVFEPGGPVDQSFPPVTVPDGAVWVMGDNRNNSADSRRHVDDDLSGTIPLDNVIGKARVIVLPPGRWGGISDPDPQTVASGPADTPVHDDWQPGFALAAGLLLTWPLRSLGADGVRAVRDTGLRDAR